MKNLALQLSFLMIIFLSSSTAMAQSPSAYVPIPDGWSLSENWLQTFKQNLGYDASGSWVLDKMGDGADMLESRNHEGFILVQEVIADTFPENMVESGEFNGNGTWLMADGRAIRENATYRCRLSGTLAGSEVRIERILLEAPVGDTTIMVTTVSPVSSGSVEILYDAGEKLALLIGKARDEKILAGED